MPRRGALKSKRSLRYAGLHATTLRAYRRALSAFLRFTNKSSAKIFTAAHLDKCVSQFLEDSFQEGEPLAYAGHLLSALKRFYPEFKLKLPRSSQYYKNWSKEYHPVRAIPATWELTEALVGAALETNQGPTALLVVLGFVGMLRTSEMMTLTYQHLVVHPNHQHISLVIPESKTSNGNPQVILLTDQHLVKMVMALRPRRHLSKPIWTKSPQAFRSSFDQLIVLLGFHSKSYVPYALRRGGATFHFQQHQSLDLTVQQGRWACAKTARLYVDSGTCQLAHVSWTKVQSRRVLQYRQKCKQWRLRQ